MANTSRINGFKPVKHLNGSPYNGQANIYEVLLAKLFQCLLVIWLFYLIVQLLLYPAVESCVDASSQIASGVIVGAVVGIVNPKIDPSGAMTAGSIALDTPQYRPASTKGFVLVADSPDLIFETEADASVALASIGLNVGVGASAHTTPLLTGTSPQYAYSTTAPTASASRPLHIVGVCNRPDNETAAAYNKILVRITTHAYGNAVAGV